MTTETPKRSRHNWTKEELAHLNRTVGHSKSKGAAFQKVADEMGLTKSAVAGTYYNHRNGSKAPKAAMAPRSAPKPTSSPVQIGRPFDFTSYSDRELIELQQAIQDEANRRIESINELKGAFSL